MSSAGASATPEGEFWLFGWWSKFLDGAWALGWVSTLATYLSVVFSTIFLSPLLWKSGSSAVYSGYRTVVASQQRTKEERHYMKTFQYPILQAAVALKWRLWMLVGGTQQYVEYLAELKDTSPDELKEHCLYHQLHTGYLIGQMMFWMEVHRRESAMVYRRDGFLQEINAKMHGVRNAFSQFRDCALLRIFHGQQMALGEVFDNGKSSGLAWNAGTGRKSGQQPDRAGVHAPIGYAEYIHRIGNEPGFRTWMGDLVQDVGVALTLRVEHGVASSRLIRIHNALVSLIRLMDDEDLTGSGCKPRDRVRRDTCLGPEVEDKDRGERRRRHACSRRWQQWRNVQGKECSPAYRQVWPRFHPDALDGNTRGLTRDPDGLLKMDETVETRRVVDMKYKASIEPMLPTALWGWGARSSIKSHSDHAGDRSSRAIRGDGNGGVTEKGAAGDGSGGAGGSGDGGAAAGGLFGARNAHFTKPQSFTDGADAAAAATAEDDQEYRLRLSTSGLEAKLLAGSSSRGMQPLLRRATSAPAAHEAHVKASS